MSEPTDTSTNPSAAHDGRRRCRGCDATSTLQNLFTLRVHKGQPAWQCPGCIAEETHRHALWALAALAALTAFGALEVTRTHGRSGWGLLNIALGYLMAWLSVLPHEFSHFLAARVVGVRVQAMRLGQEPIVAHFNLFGLPILLGAYPWAGAVYLHARDNRWLRWQLFITFLAGPMSHLLMLCAAIFGAREVWQAELASTGLAPVCAFIAANVVMLLGNLVPSKPGKPGLANDGRQLLGLLKREHMDEIRKDLWQHDLIGAHILMQMGQWNLVEERARPLAAAHPENGGTSNLLHVSLIHLNRYEEARTLGAALIQVPPTTEYEAVALNNNAWVCLQLDRPELIEEALRYSELAHANLPWNASCLSTRAHALALHGDAQEALRLMDSKRARRARGRSNRASMRCAAAFAHARLGDRTKAEALLASGRRLDASSKLIPRVQALLDSSTPSPR